MNISVTNLSLNVVEDDLKKLFSAYGKVGFVFIIRDTSNGRSSGKASVEMPVRAQAEQAIRGLHQTEVDGQRISVQEIEYKAGEFNN